MGLPVPWYPPCNVLDSLYSDCISRLHRMHEILTILTDVHSVCLSVCLSHTYAMCRVYGVIWCSLCQITLATCLFLLLWLPTNVNCVLF